MEHMGSESKKILAVSLEGGGRRAQALAVWDGSSLMVLELHDILGDPATWLPAMQADIKNKLAGGWVVLVEDRTASFPVEATSYNFDTMGTDGRTNLQTALDWYFALSGRGALILDPSMKKYALRMGGENSAIDAKNDEKGRLVYNINWQAFTACHRALLMCVAGAVMEEPFSDRWMEKFLGVKPPQKRLCIWPVFRAMRRWSEQMQWRLEEKIEATEARKMAFEAEQRKLHEQH